jgi:deoxyribodipyrimidine photolyase-related protein
MSKFESALLLYPNQLFNISYLPKVDVVYLVEEPLYFGADEQYPVAFHKQKLVMHRASMRRYVEEQLWPNNINVEYIELHQIVHTSDILQIAQKAGVSLLTMFDPADYAIEKRLQEALETIIASPFELKVLPSPSFMLRRGDIQEFFAGQKNFKFAPFYQWQRERFNILIDKKYKPVGGKWNFDADNRKALPAGHVPPGFASFGDSPQVKDAIKWVNKRFNFNPGNIDSFMWPTSHQEAERWLAEFIKERLDNFGAYEDAIDGQAMLLYHSGISAPLNSGLLTPSDVVEAVLNYHAKKPVPLASLEGFIRQIIGWREYIRALYVLNGSQMRVANKLNQQRLLSNSWWDGSLGIPPVDDVIKKVNNHAYAHHIERLMVVGNFMLLCGIQPTEVYKWYMSLFIDAYDWVMVPNVYGMSQFSDLGSMVTKPYISGSNYILKMSHYKKDLWCDVWDGLFWGFVQTHQELLLKNPRTSMLPRSLKRLNPDHHRIIGYRAKDFLDNI